MDHIIEDSLLNSLSELMRSKIVDFDYEFDKNEKLIKVSIILENGKSLEISGENIQVMLSNI